MPKPTSGPTVTVTKNGPYHVTGSIPLTRQTIVAGSDGDPEKYQEGAAFPAQESYWLCRCGHSAHKPYCDGTHKQVGFDGTETASHEPWREQAKGLEGPAHHLGDAQALCAGTDFCIPNGTVWEQVARTGDPAVRDNFLRQVKNCPSGRLVAFERASGEAIEPTLERSIGVLEHPAENASGPLWLRGGIPVIAGDGFAYEVRNRVTLCRCGASANKPFCDGSHYKIGFRDWE